MSYYHWPEGREPALQPPEPKHGECPHFVPWREHCEACWNLLDEEEQDDE